MLFSYSIRGVLYSIRQEVDNDRNKGHAFLRFWPKIIVICGTSPYGTGACLTYKHFQLSACSRSMLTYNAPGACFTNMLLEHVSKSNMFLV